MKIKSSILAITIALHPLSPWAYGQESYPELDPWLTNPISKYVTKEQWNEVTQEVLGNKQRYETQTLFVNTNDRTSCEETQRTIRANPLWQTSQDIEELCTPNADYPWASVTIVKPVTAAEMHEELRVPIDLRPQNPGLGQETFNMGVMGMTTMGILVAMPESITKWDKSKSSDKFLDKWKRNITSGPVVDKDEWAVNYIGHPVSGAAYYVVARHMNYSILDSLKYTFLMSTFFWEYGLEAPAERPSIQDIIITPVLGSLLGEVYFQATKQIENNGNKVLGSNALGQISLFLLNPAGTISKRINRIMDSSIIESTTSYFYIRQQQNDPLFPEPQHRSSVAGFELVFHFW